MGKKKKSNSQKPGPLSGYLAAVSFSALTICGFYLDMKLLIYLSVIPAAFVVVWFAARIADEK